MKVTKGLLSKNDGNHGGEGELPFKTFVYVD